MVEELRLRITSQEGRCTALQTELERALHFDVREATDGMQARADIFSSELQQIRQVLTETAAQRDRLIGRLLRLGMAEQPPPDALNADYRWARTELHSQIQAELVLRDRFARWEETHRRRGTERRLDPLRTLEDQSLVATLSVRWQFIDYPPQSFRHRPRWLVDGQLLDPLSEQFLLRQSQERVTYRLRIMGDDAGT